MRTENPERDPLTYGQLIYDILLLEVCYLKNLKC